MSFSPVFQQGSSEELDSMGKDLSAILHCPVRYLGAIYDHPGFECSHMIPFPEFAVKYAHDSGDWSQIMHRHSEWIKGNFNV